MQVAGRRSVVGAVVLALLLTLGLAVRPPEARAEDRPDATTLRARAEKIAPDRDDATRPLGAREVRAPLRAMQRALPSTAPEPPRLPAAWSGTEAVAAEGAADAPSEGADAGSPVVRVGLAPGAEAPAATAEVAVDVLDQRVASAAGVQGVLLRVGTPVDPEAPDGPAASQDAAPSAGTASGTARVENASFAPAARRLAAAPTSSPRPDAETPSPAPSTSGTPTGAPTATPTPTSDPTPAAPAPTDAPTPDAPPADAGTTPEAAAALAEAPLEVEVDYGTFARAYGGAWASRLRVVSLPDCALTTPDRAECREQTPLESRNDLAASTVTAVVPASSARVMALAAAPAGGAGSFQATSLSPSSSWQVSGQTGTFSWAYPLRVPPALGGPEPELALSYSSSAVDGKVASTNNQSSWIGEGWDLATGFVERRYQSCAQDRGGAANNKDRVTGDLCWMSDNATLSLSGHSSELVKDAATGTWRLKEDDGTRVERLTGGFNDDNDGEYWKVTTTDGTQYVFGRGQRSATDTTKTNSAWSVPVYGNHPGDPCYSPTYAASWCMQTWRWNLEYVVDTSGNSLTTTYATETNGYGRNLGEAVSTYVRGGYPVSIEYGQVAGSEASTPAPMRVDFTVSERCLPTAGVACDPGAIAPAQASAWPDVPADLVCTSTTSCPSVTSPVFFSRKRLTGVTTKVRSGTSYQAVDSWTLTHTFPDPGDSTDKAMWLDRIGHKGMVGTAITLPDVKFAGTQMANRVDTLGDAGPPMNRFRINAIETETGARVSLNYTPQDCTVGNLPASPESNTRRCFPVRWQPVGEGGPIVEYFHKYLVSSVVENPNDDASLSVQTAYTYHGDAAWRFDDNPFVPESERTWNEFRGYETVDVTTGAATAQRSMTRTRYFRGMDGDRLPGGGTRSVAVDGIADVDRLNGFVREEVVFDGPGGAELSGTRNVPWVSAPTATGADGSRATYIGVGTVEERTAAPALPGGSRTTRVVTTYDPTYGVATQVDDQGDVSVPGDDRCTRIEYVRNTAKHIVATTSRTEVVGVGCGATPARPADVISDKRVAYDGQAVGVAPTRGLVTSSQSLSGWNGSTPTYTTDETTTHDVHGRAVSTTDALGARSTIAYTPATGGPVTGVAQTTPDPDGSGPRTAMTTTTVVHPAWGTPTRQTDANGKVTSATVDALGRTTAVWLPGRPQASTTASMTFAYTVSATGPSSVTTQTLTAKGDYQKTVELYDGMLRPRQTQSVSTSRDNPGRLVTDTGYDSRGLVAYENGQWFTTGAPSATLVRATSAVPARTRYLYDGAGRTTAEIFDVGEQERWRTTTTYGGDRVSVDPPTGGMPETSISDARGQLVELWQYTGDAPTGDHVTATYEYDRAGRRTAVTDGAGNRWTYTYDVRGRQVATNDPDKGASSTTYDAADQVVSTTDARGVTSVVVRDLLGRPLEQRLGTATGELQASWVYDTLAKGQLTSSTRHVSGSAYTTAVTGYDDAYRPVGQSVTIPAAEGKLAGTYTTAYEYALDGQRSSVTLPAAGNLKSEKVTTYFDALSVPEWMAGSGLNGAYVTGTLYDAYGELLRYGAGNTYVDFVNYTYETGTRRLSKTWTQREGVSGYDQDITYSYDAAGNPTSVVDRPTGKPVDAQCYRYDGLQRLTHAWTPSSASCTAAPSVAGLGGPAPYWREYGFDVAGNRTSEVQRTSVGTTTYAYTYPAAGQPRPHAVTAVTATGPTGTTTSTYGYDAAGNTITRNRAGKPAQSLSWDADGRLKQVSESGSTAAGTYVYTAEGDRLVRRQGGVTTVYLPGGQELNLTVSTGTVTAVRYYEFGGSTVAVRTGPSNSDVTSLVSDPHQTASLAIANVSHAVTVRRTDPYGNARGGTPAWPGDRGFLNKPTDTTGLTQVGARYYDAALGRFISVDPVMDLGKPQQWAAYTYADNNPMTFWDPTGMLSWGSAWKSVKNAVGKGASAVGGFVKKYQAEIVGFAVGTVVTAGCLAVTAGAGSAACLALGGAAGSASTNLWKTKVQKTQKFSWRSLAQDTAIGGLTAAVSGVAGRYVMKIPGVQRAVTSAGSAIRGAVNRPVSAISNRAANLKPSGAKPNAAPPSAKPAAKPAANAEARPSGGGACSIGNSFTASTPVLMANGAKKPIKDVQVGDLVMATDPKTGLTGYRPVVNLIRHSGDHTMVKLTLADGTVIDATDKHPIWDAVKRTFVDAVDLKAGQEVLAAGVAMTIATASVYSADLTAYNFEVADLHTYYVGETPVLVHNTSPCEVGGESFSGGRYRELPTGGGIEVHHMPANSVSPLPRGDGPAIQMLRLDHYQTGSWGSSRAASAYRAAQRELIDAGKFDDAIQMDIDDVTSRFPGKYDNAILEMIDRLPGGAK
jgi:RHS repeat-associated protein